METINLSYHEARLLYSLLYGMDYDQAMGTISSTDKAKLGGKLHACYKNQEEPLE